MTEEAPAPTEGAGEQGDAPARPRRRRRGGRGRSRTGERTPRDDAAEPSEGQDDSPERSASATRRRAARPKPRPDEDAEDGAGAGPDRDAGSPADGEERPKAPARRRRPPARKPPATEGEGGDEGRDPGEGEETTSEDEGGAQRPKRRRRRRRSSSGQQTEAADGAEASPEDAQATDALPDAPEEEGDGPAPAKRRRRSRSRSGGTKEGTKEGSKGETAAEAAPSKGPLPTRTASRARRGRVVRRRREPTIMPERRTDKVMLITERGDRDQIAVVEGRELVEHYVTRVGANSMVGNIYLGRVQNVLPGMEAAFVDVGRGRNAVLYAGEVSYDEEIDEDARRIEQVLKPGDGVLVQVTKDPMGGKGARLTGQVSVPGRYLVYVPDGGASGISRRLPETERSRLRGIMKTIRPSGSGVIVRTAAEGASEEALAEDLERLKKTWDSIKRKSRRAKPPKLLYEEPELTIRVIRDVFSPTEFVEIVTDSPNVHGRVTTYLEDLAPDLLSRLRLHEGPLPVFEAFHVAEQIHKALERKVWLPSGGYLIIDRTEAMTIVDVNTGKAVGKTNLEETVVGTNLEAAREIARQLRLRDIGGIIVIDFIDMLLQANRTQVIRELKQAMAQDKTRSQVFDITPLGLLEVTRKRVSAGLVESFSETCPTCEGRGILVTHEI